MPIRLRGVAVAAIWIAAIVLASLLTSALTGRAWLAAGIGVAGMSLAAWRALTRLADANAARQRAEQERAAMQQALRRSQKMEALGRLTAGIAHDFNNHLTVISSNVELVARRLDGSQERLRRHTEAALGGVQRAALLTGRLLSFSRQATPDPEPVDVDRLLEGLSDLLCRTLGDRISLDVTHPAPPWLVWADLNQMESALLSLAVNLSDQVLDGAKLTIAVSNVHLPGVLDPACRAMLPGDYLPGDYLQIALSGCAPGASPRAGAPLDWLAADDLTSPDLLMAGTFLREAGGYLQRSSSLAGGSSLRLLLPRYVPPRPAVPPRREARDGPTILVVEDDAAVRAANVEVLRELN